ncbi:MAG: HAMP domain-containing protein [Gammaproteobacteria bacterium]|nr:HAMP domain-containing protein [Gammaproteobacteria bacterium]
MRLRLFHKLLLVLAGTSLVSVLLFAGFAHWYIHQSFLRYLNEAREQRLESVAEALEALYRRDGDWRALRDDPHAWRLLLRRVMRASSATGDMEIPPPPDARAFPPPRRHEGPPLEPGLLDATRHPVVGAALAPSAEGLRALRVDGQVVGWLGLPPLRHPANPRDQRFAERQAHILLIGAGLTVMVSILAATLVARRHVRPITRIGASARALASGDFKTRLPRLGDDEIGALADDFNLMARTLEENESARRRWFADVSHELRTPLTIMRGELEAARDGVRPLNAALLASLEQEAARLHHLVEDLYQLARADIGALDYEFAQASLGALVTESLTHFAHRWQQAGLSYDYQLDAELQSRVDQRRFRQLLENLFENATRYTDAPGRIRVSLSRDGDEAHLVVADSAPGVPPEELPLLFEPLHRAERSRSRAHGGSGLGLAICQRIVTAHGGRISAAPAPEGGVAIHVHLPLAS